MSSLCSNTSHMRVSIHGNYSVDRSCYRTGNDRRHFGRVLDVRIEACREQR